VIIKAHKCSTVCVFYIFGLNIKQTKHCLQVIQMVMVLL
jgi:hypothetical protein